MVSIVAQLHVRLQVDIYMLYINHFAVYNPDIILIQFRLQEREEIPIFLAVFLVPILLSSAFL